MLCLKADSSMVHTIENLVFDGDPTAVVQDLIQRVKQLNLRFNPVGPDKACKDTKVATIRFEIQGKMIVARDDHHYREPGESEPQISVLTMNDENIVKGLQDFYLKLAAEIILTNEPLVELNNFNTVRKYKNNLSSDERRMYALKHIKADNYTTNERILAKIF